MKVFKPPTRAALAALLLAGATGCVTAAPPSHAPAYGYRSQGHYSYVYYPRADIYYAPDRRYWYWRSSRGWHHGHRLPRNYAHLTVGGVRITLADSTPYRHHRSVRYSHRRGYAYERRHHDRKHYKPRNKYKYKRKYKYGHKHRKHRRDRGRGYWDGHRRRR